MLDLQTHWWRFLAPGNARLWVILTLVGCYTAGVIWWDDHAFPAKKLLEADAILFTSAVMGVLLVFRTNSAYDRWWEARKLWGQLVNDLRNLSIKMHRFARPDAREGELLSGLLAGFAVALRDHLRGIKNSDCIPEPWRKEALHHDHVPLAVASIVYGRIAKWRREGTITEFEGLQLDRHALALMDVCGASERIRRSPIAGSYKMLLWLGLTLSFLVGPWLLVPTLDDWTLLLVLLSAYFVFALELLAEEVEEPFGTQPNDLPLDVICETIRRSVREVLCPGQG